MTEQQRIKKIIKWLIFSDFAENDKEVAENLGYTKSSLSQIVTGKVPVSEKFIKKLCSADKNINEEWINTGEGEMLKTDTPIVSYNKGIPYYNVDFIGGFDLVCNDQTTKPDYYIDFSPYNEEGTIWCNITGHSMEPEINNGDMIALKEVKEWNNFLTYGEIYAIVTKNGMRTVKIVSRGDDNDSFKLVPINENKKYSIQDIQKSMIDKVFKVMGCMKRL